MKEKEEPNCSEFVAVQIVFDKRRFLEWLDKYKNWVISSNLIKKAGEEL